ncbi:MAG: N-acetylglucosamine-6-phosphate deacetylase [Spirulina sp. SIO3F2]|nr:N-acetylglucosamine-6-phosphate deacetylase [Spirulina sp. SIO3F2]
MEQIDLERYAATQQIIDCQGDWLSPGGIDLQINGGLGLAFPDLTPADLPKLESIATYLWQQGIDGFCPTIVTTAVEKIQQSLAVIAASSLRDWQPGRAQILGVHLEGPFLNPAKRGAHPKDYLLPLTLGNVQQVLGDYADLVSIMTLAPEIAESAEVIPYLRDRGIVVSLGHSLATAAEANQAFDQGATMVTHAFNAMPSLHHRKPGLLGAALAHSNVQSGFIADGQHVCPTMLQLLLRSGRLSQGLFLVSDALAPIGLPDGVYPWDSRQITVTNGTARLPDGTLSGTTLPLLVGVENLVRWGLCELHEAIALATTSPRQALGLAPDAPHSMLQWHWDEMSASLSWQRVAQ